MDDGDLAGEVGEVHGLLDSAVAAADHVDLEVGEEDSKVMKLSESVSVSSDGTINVTIGNLSVSDDEDVTIVLTDKEIKSVEASIVTGGMTDHNTFDDPEKVTEKAFKDHKTDGRKLSFTLPKNSVVLLRVK